MRPTGGWGRLLALAAGLVCAGASHAQAWLPDGGTTGYSLSYTDTFDKNHYLPNGDLIDAGHIRFKTLGFGVLYSPTDNWQLNAVIPLISSEYHGDHPHPTEVDNGQYHTTFTDLRVEAHYQLSLEPVALAPYVAYVLPTHDYETLGHAAPGRGLHETWLGIGAGTSLDRWIPRTYVQARFTYAIVEKVANVSHDKENIEFEAGFFVTPDISVQALGQWQRTLGGIDVPVPPTNPLFPHHDQLAADGFTNVGASAAWMYSDHAQISALYLTGVAGRDGHQIRNSFSLIFSYGFGYGLGPRR